jgi:hypothetical protein
MERPRPRNSVSAYRDMQEMFFGRPTSWPDIVGKLRVLEAQINRH